MFDWFRPAVDMYSIAIDAKCSNKLCNKSVIVPAQLSDKAMVYCDGCRNAMQSRPINGKEHYRYNWKLKKAERVE